MIYDNLSNISTYKNISQDIYFGLCFLQQVKPDIEIGIYQINPRARAIVSEYETKHENEVGFEAHKKFIDIQYNIKGVEKVGCLPIERLKKTKTYSSEIDAAFYMTDEKPQEMIIGDGYFAIFFPQDGHMPQLSVDKPKMVKKVVVKIEI